MLTHAHETRSKRFPENKILLWGFTEDRLHIFCAASSFSIEFHCTVDLLGFPTLGHGTPLSRRTFHHLYLIVQWLRIDILCQQKPNHYNDYFNRTLAWHQLPMTFHLFETQEKMPRERETTDFCFSFLNAPCYRCPRFVSASFLESIDWIMSWKMALLVDMQVNKTGFI